MTGDRAAQFALYAVMLVLPLSALVARRLPVRLMLKMALAWMGIFAAALVIASQRDRFPKFSRVFGDQAISGSETRIRMADDGHFWADVEINGVKRRMLIDSGATTTALSSATARAAGLETDENPFPVIVDTANGQVAAHTATVKVMTVGSIGVTDLGVITSRSFGNTDVIGMNFLSRLRSWRVEATLLVLTPEPV